MLKEKSEANVFALLAKPVRKTLAELDLFQRYRNHMIPLLAEKCLVNCQQEVETEAFSYPIFSTF
jgi:hypothetical protein